MNVNICKLSIFGLGIGNVIHYFGKFLLIFGLGRGWPIFVPKIGFEKFLSQFSRTELKGYLYKGIAKKNWRISS